MGTDMISNTLENQQEWIVSHFHDNPKFNTVRIFDNKKDAIDEVRMYSSDDGNQTSTIENKRTGAYGERIWTKKNISWNKRYRPI